MFSNDVRFAAKRLIQRPGLAVVVVLTLALSLGINTAIFTIINALTAQELPVRNAHELYRLGDDATCCVNTGLQDNYSIFSTHLYLHLRDSTAEFREVAGFQANVTPSSIRRVGSSITNSVAAQYVSGNYFQTFGVTAEAGRLLDPSDDAPGSAPVFVMSHRTWTSQYGADPTVVGASFVINGRPMTLAGIAERPFFGDTVRANPPGLWMPLGQEAQNRGAGALTERSDTNWLYAIGRLAPGATVAKAQVAVTSALQQWLEAQSFLSDADKKSIPRRSIRIAPAVGGVRMLGFSYAAPVSALFMMSALVLLIAVANLSNLLLARADRGEVAIRTALGASQAQIVRQVLIEGVLLAAAGGAAGMLVSRLTSRAVVALAFPGVEYLPIDLEPGLNVALFSIGLALLTGVLFSSAPAWAMARVNPSHALRGGGRVSGTRGFIPHRTLVVIQVALSMVLLFSAGLLIESLRRLERQPLGFDPKDRVVIRLNPPALVLPPDGIGDVYSRLLETVERIPGAAQATYALYSPMDGSNWSSGIRISGDDRDISSSWNRVGPNYFQVLGTRVRRGRDFVGADHRPTSRVTIVNEAFVRQFLDGKDPLATRIGLGGPNHADDLEIVGVVEDVKYAMVTRPARPMFFLPGMQTVDYADPSLTSMQSRSQRAQTLILKTDAPIVTLHEQVRRAVADVDPDFSVARVTPMVEQIKAAFGVNRLLAWLAVAFGVFSLALAVLGVYGVTAFSVTKRTREIGIRIALGADRASIVRLIVQGAVVQAAAGVIIGGVAAFSAAGVIRALIYEINPRDPYVMTGAFLVLLGSAAGAAAVPALRASRLAANTALRTD